MISALVENEPSPMPMERRRVYYTGHVQGVGFRFRSQRVAQGFAVAGFVRNLDDGRVELLAEGDRDVLDSFLDAVRRELNDHIAEVHVSTEPPDDPWLRGFIIRY